MSNMIEVINLKKSYSTVDAVKGINFSVDEGKFAAFLGENGAGKSTTINIMSTLLKKTSGDVIINGNKIDANDTAIRNDIGVIFQGKMLDDFLTVRENIFSRGRLYGLSKQTIEDRLDHLTKKINLTEFLDRPYGKLSGGQKRRADIVRALINEPKILILDEPTTGLDPYTRRQVWKSIKELQEETNLTVFLTTHYMEEAATADYIIVIDQGEIKAQDTPENLRINYSYDKLFILPKQQQPMMNQLNEMNLNYKIDRDRLIIPLKNCFDAIDIVTELKNNLTAFEVIRGNMDDVFINLVGDKSKKEGVMINAWIIGGLVCIPAISVPLMLLCFKVEDVANGIQDDLFVTPTNRTHIMFGYVLSAWIVGLVMTLITLFLGELFIVINGGEWLSFVSLLKVIGILALTIFSFSAFPLFIIIFLKSTSAITVINSILNTLLGFFLGLYIPIGMLSDNIAIVLKSFPLLQVASLLRQIIMQDALDVVFKGVPNTIVSEVRELYGVDIVIGDHLLKAPLILFILVLFGIIFYISSAFVLKYRKAR